MTTHHTPTHTLLPYMLASRHEAGADEAGRGPLAGPVAAAAVILPADISPADLPDLDDSKKLTPAQRRTLAPIIKDAALAWAIAACSPQEIDQMNILRASITAMHRAIRQLTPQPDFLLIDGNRFRPYYRDFDDQDPLLRLHDESSRIPHQCVIKGDGKYLSIAAASVLAKTWRDDLMERLDSQYPGYGWAHNMGYPTKDHYDALRRLGPTPLHRMSFNLKLDK